MTFISQVADHVAGVVGKIGRRAEELPANVDGARRALADRVGRTRRIVHENPVLVIVGAFAIGVGLAKLARHA